MPRGTTYANNASNQSLGRAGMAMGSAPVSRSSGGGSSSGAVSRGSSGGSSQSSTSTYVDNASNRSLGRVGMAHGTAVVSRSSTPSSGSTDTYVDNSYNRSLGRVGMERGSMTVSKSSATSANSYGSDRTYVDNAYNRSVGRVGMILGTMSISKSSKSSSSSSRKADKPEQKLYADNAANRRLDRAGKPFGSMPVSSKKTESTRYLQRAYEHYMNTPDDEFDPTCAVDHDMEEHLADYLNRMEVNTSHDPFEWYDGPIIQFSDLDIGKKIGHGGFGDVHQGKLKGKEVAIKKLRVQRVSQKRLTQFEGEVKVFCKLQHKNIITFYGACVTTPNICIVMEYMNGSLYDELHIKEHQFNDKEQKFIAMEIADGLVYLHSKNVAHCDVKPSNVLINIADSVDKKHQVKITDFGLSKIKNYAETSRSSSADALERELGTPRYSAPEVLRGEFLDTKGMMMADVYSFGLVMFEICSGDEVFDDYNAHQLKKNVGHGDHKPAIADLQLSLPLQELMLKCWVRETTRRPTAKECVSVLKDAY